MQELMILLALISLVISFVWLFIGWSAMRAHEKLADQTERLAYAAEKLAKDYRPPSSEDGDAYKTGGV